MARKASYEVIGTKPVCVDFADGRSISFRPGTRFEAHPTNVSVRRLLRVKEIRELGPNDYVPPLPVKLGAPKHVRTVVERRSAAKNSNQKPESVKNSDSANTR